MATITAKFPEARVLVVEDNPLNQQLLIAMLNIMRCETSVASDGKEGLELYGSEEYSIILMDVLMLIMDGFETTKAIRELEEKSGKHIPIIAVTAIAMPDDKKKCLDSGMDDYLSKPIKGMEIEALFRKYIPELEEK